MNAVLLITAALGSSTVLASEPKEEVEDFRSFMVGHRYEGCPENSVCSQRTGELRKRWSLLLKEASKRRLKEFVDSHGIPVGVWTTKKSDAVEGMVVWDSPCPNHNKKGAEVYDAEILLKNFQDLPAEASAFTDRVLVLKPGGQSVYDIPRGGVPILMDGGRLYFSGEVGGLYYTFSVSDTGKLSLEDAQGAGYAPEAVECPDNVGRDFAKVAARADVYGGHRCKRIGNGADAARPLSGGSVIVVHGWACL